MDLKLKLIIIASFVTPFLAATGDAMLSKSSCLGWDDYFISSVAELALFWVGFLAGRVSKK